MSTITPISQPQAVEPALSVIRLNVVRAGYLFMAAGLTLKKWPLIPYAADRPLYESVTICMLIAMSLLAWLGLRHPVKMLPILIFESAWKLLWLSAVAFPLAASGDLDPTTSEGHAELLAGRRRPGRHPLAIRLADLRSSTR